MILLPPESRDPRVRLYGRPVGVVWQSGVCDAENLVGGSSSGHGCVLCHEQGSPGLLLDFGTEMHGGIRVHRSGGGPAAPVRLRIRLGETAADALVGASSTGAIQDHEVLVPRGGRTEFGESGFRFARIDLMEPGVSVGIRAVEAVRLQRPMDRLGAFRCSDSVLTRVWEMAADTLHLCMQDHLWQDLVDSRSVRMPALYTAVRGVASVFGDAPVVRPSLDIVRDALEESTGETGCPLDCLWWVITHHAWYQARGDDSYLDAQRASLLNALAIIGQGVGEDGAFCFEPDDDLWESVQLTPGSRGDAQGLLQALATWALQTGASLCHEFGETEAQIEAQSAANLLRAHRLEGVTHLAAISLMTMMGLAEADEIRTQAFAAPEGARTATSFEADLALQALAHAGEHAGAVDCLRGHWGAMAARGGTTCWTRHAQDMPPLDALPAEGKQQAARVNRCDSGAAGPAAWLMEQVLGLKVVEPGGAAILVRPGLHGLDWAEGSLPTPAGVVRIRLERTEDGRTKVDLDAPQSVRIVRG